MNSKVSLLYGIPVIWCCLFLIGCKSQKQGTAILFDKNPPFVIAEAQYQRWTSTNNLTNSGWNIIINFEEIEPTVTIEEIFFREHRGELQNSSEFPNRYIGNITDKKRNFIMHSDPLKEAANTPPKEPLFRLEANEAVIQYRFQGKDNYYKITALKETHAVPYPR